MRLCGLTDVGKAKRHDGSSAILLMPSMINLGSTG
jgi:hypothetical protein